MKKILILGDSFAADWSIKYRDYKGWPNLLAETYNTNNLAQAGVAEYKIYKQLECVESLDDYSCIIISHTSPYRVHTRNHPVHWSDSLHKNADLIYGDIEYHHYKKWQNFFNKSLKAAFAYFTHHYDPDFYETTYWLYRKEISNRLNGCNTIVIDNFNKDTGCLNFTNMYPEYSGKINHFNQEGNRIIYNLLVKEIEKFNK